MRISTFKFRMLISRSATAFLGRKPLPVKFLESKINTQKAVMLFASGGGEG